MDKGAHFHKCDIQVHTPRDAAWDGAGAVSDEERHHYAEEFVTACRGQGIQAVAITDHHDVAFFRYIRDAALGETDEAGQALDPSQRLTVFPGIELTLGIPCQALLIFDAELAVEFLPIALAALGITPSEAQQEKTAPTKKLDIMSFEDLYKALDKLDPLRGRYIVFPHFSDGGHKSLLRKDFEKHYIAMPCVGGYVDGDLPTDENKSKGWRNITNGLDKNWGNKPIGMFQTSDSRSRKHEKLGAHVTWVKWAKPTAEALRQACLSRHSRLLHREPRLPAIHITRIEVSNSKFMGPINLDLNPQYNAIIGGRGTGKSTILEYVRWALCDQPPTGPLEDVPDFQKRRQALVEGTLLPLGAVVDINFVLNEVEHVVRRKAMGELTLKIAGGPFQLCTEQNVRELLQIRAYSQKQLSAVGARLDELRRFVHAPIEGDLDKLDGQIAAFAANMRVQFDWVLRHRALQTEIGTHDLEITSLKEQLEKLRGSLKGLSPADTAIIARQGHYEQEQRAVQSMERDAASARAALQALMDELNRLPTPLTQSDLPASGPLLKEAHTALTQWVMGVRGQLVEAQEVFAEPVDQKALGDYFRSIRAWQRGRDRHRTEYEQAKVRAAAHEQTLQQIRSLEERLAEINSAADDKRQRLIRLGEPLKEFNATREELKSAYSRRAQLLEAQCATLSSVGRSRLRATLRRAADIEPLGEMLKKQLTGAKIRGDHFDQLTQQIAILADPLVGGDSLAAWNGILDELLDFAWLTVDDEAVTQLPPSPRLDSAGFTPKEKMALARQLKPPTWLDLALFDLKDLPVFEYEIREDDFIPFENASPGQQATALLSILLLQDGPPLLIDQPEDDLNMKIINEIVETLWQAKSHRQVLFVSHNANLVVNGDAELVACCDYRTTATESGGQIKRVGAIDVPEINDEIAEVMEGGVEAFKLRYRKYGF